MSSALLLPFFFSASHPAFTLKATNIGEKGSTAIIEALQSPNCLLQELYFTRKRKEELC